MNQRCAAVAVFQRFINTLRTSVLHANDSTLRAWNSLFLNISVHVQTAVCDVPTLPRVSKISHNIFRPRDVIQPQLKTNTLKSGSHHCVHQYERASNKAEKNVWPGACPTARRSTFLSHCSGPVRLLDTLRLKSRAIFDGSNLMPIHTSCRSRDVVFTLTFGCTRAIYELKGIYNV